MEQKQPTPEKTAQPEHIPEKSREKGAKTILYILLGISVLAIGLFLFIPGLTRSSEFTYKSPAGEEFEFITGYAGKIPVYTLKINVNYGNKLIKPYEIPLRNKPNDLKEILIQGDVKQKLLNSRGVFITMDPELDQKASIAAIQLAKVIGTADYGVFKIPTQGAFTQSINTTNNQDYPVKNCQDATPDIRVVLLKLGNENKAYTDDNCIILEATDSDNIIRVAEKVVLTILNVV